MLAKISHRVAKLIFFSFGFARLRNSTFTVSQGLRDFARLRNFLSSVCKACEHFVRVQNSFFTILLSVLQLILLLGILQACKNFAQPCEIVGCQIPSLIFFLTCLIDLAKASKLSKTWILHVLELSSCFSMDYTTFPSLLSHFNDKKTIKNTQNLPNIDQYTCKGP